MSSQFIRQAARRNPTCRVTPGYPKARPRSGTMGRSPGSPRSVTAQYSAGVSTVVCERSASVMTHSLSPRTM